MRRIILFDGVCNFCDSSVQFIIKRDPEGIYKFAALQSEAGLKLLKEFNIPEILDSIVLIEGQHYYKKSDAAIRIARNFKGLWKHLGLLTILPLPMRDYLYDIIARNRYKWFGKKESCMLPSTDFRSRFLE
jgi:predicted DCC family thiol-disulfide oxidoreductase YuxK